MGFHATSSVIGQKVSFKLTYFSDFRARTWHVSIKSTDTNQRSV